MQIPVSTVHTIQIQSATKQIEKLGFGRLIKNSKSGSLWMVSARLLCPCSERLELFPERLGAELS